MFRINVFIPQADLSFLKTFNEVTISEHVRRALAEYVNKLKNEKVSKSSSQLKYGEKNG